MHQAQKGKIFKLLMSFVLLFLISCTTAPQEQENAVLIPQGYMPLNQDHPKDKAFLVALENSLKKLGSLIAVYVDTAELNLYRDNKRSYPTNYRYIIKANPKASLEEIKNANLSLQN